MKEFTACDKITSSSSHREQVESVDGCDHDDKSVRHPVMSSHNNIVKKFTADFQTSAETTSAERRETRPKRRQKSVVRAVAHRKWADGDISDDTVTGDVGDIGEMAERQTVPVQKSLDDMTLSVQRTTDDVTVPVRRSWDDLVDSAHHCNHHQDVLRRRQPQNSRKMVSSIASDILEIIDVASSSRQRHVDRRSTDDKRPTNEQSSNTTTAPAVSRSDSSVTACLQVSAVTATVGAGPVSTVPLDDVSVPDCVPSKGSTVPAGTRDRVEDKMTGVCGESLQKTCHDAANSCLIERAQTRLSTPGRAGNQRLTNLGRAGNRKLTTPGRSGNQKPTTPGHADNQKLTTTGCAGNQRLTTPRCAGNQKLTTPGRAISQSLTTPEHAGNQKLTTPGRASNQKLTTQGRANNQRLITPGRAGNPKLTTPGCAGNQKLTTPGHPNNQSLSTPGGNNRTCTAVTPVAVREGGAVRRDGAVMNALSPVSISRLSGSSSSPAVKRNAKGETQLHTAAIKVTYLRNGSLLAVN